MIKLKQLITSRNKLDFLLAVELMKEKNLLYADIVDLFYLKCSIVRQVPVFKDIELFSIKNTHFFVLAGSDLLEITKRKFEFYKTYYKPCQIHKMCC